MAKCSLLVLSPELKRQLAELGTRVEAVAAAGAAGDSSALFAANSGGWRDSPAFSSSVSVAAEHATVGQGEVVDAVDGPEQLAHR